MENYRFTPSYLKHCLLPFQDLQVFQIESDNQNKAYVSWSGEEVVSSDGADGVLKINGLYGAKLGLGDGDDVS